MARQTIFDGAGRFEMRDLSGLANSFALVEFAVLTAIFGFPLDEHHTLANVRSLVRLVDKTVVEHEAARSSYLPILGQHSAPPALLEGMLRGANHIETLVNALHRAIETARLLQRTAPPLQITKAELPRKPDVDRIRHQRDAMEHAREWFGDGRIPTGPTMLHIWPEGFEFAGDEIGFEELARWLEQMYALCLRLRSLIGQAPPAA